MVVLDVEWAKERNSLGVLVMRHGLARGLQDESKCRSSIHHITNPHRLSSKVQGDGARGRLIPKTRRIRQDQELGMCNFLEFRCNMERKEAFLPCPEHRLRGDICQGAVWKFSRHLDAQQTIGTEDDPPCSLSEHRLRLPPKEP